jgi:hypothetical protein
MEDGVQRQGKRRSGYSSMPEEHNKRRSKRGSMRSSDDRAIGADGQRSKQIGEVDCGGVRWWVDRINPIAPPSVPFKYLVETLACIKERNEWIKRLQVHYIFVSLISLATALTVHKCDAMLPLLRIK